MDEIFKKRSIRKFTTQPVEPEKAEEILRAAMAAPEFDQIDLSIATENLLLEITSLGLGGVRLAIAPVEERIEKPDRVLGIGECLHAFALVAVGYAAEEKTPVDRFDETRVHYL